MILLICRFLKSLPLSTYVLLVSGLRFISAAILVSFIGMEGMHLFPGFETNGEISPFLSGAITRDDLLSLLVTTLQEN